ncbi:DUF2505 family protein [Schaalia sp. ZJ1691]|uniref:DUF2505 family protein n=1 Tax=Schaalia sp. ZJ1691 TaxID=2709404 RepID=UPI0013EA8A82|nr:DUF2505 family protein [Schaalia sp. ZJ1691]
MDFSFTVTYPASACALVAAILDPSFQIARLSGLSTGEPHVNVTGNRIDVTGYFAEDAFPDKVRGYLSFPLKFSYCEELENGTSNEANPHSTQCPDRIHSVLTVDAAHLRVDLTSTLSEAPSTPLPGETTPASVTRTGHGTLSVSIPFFGSTIEQKLLEHVQELVAAEEHVTTQWLTSTHSTDHHALDD